VDEAFPLLERVLEEAERSGFMYEHALYVTWLSEAYLLAERRDDALALAQHALTHSHAQKERGHQAYALRLLGEIAARRQPLDVAQAEAHYQQALTLAEELGMRPLQAHCHLGLGMLYAKTGQPAPAAVELSAAIELYRAMGMTCCLPQAETVLARMEGR
jgi:tetratricopeptide (TPR) repeat protein